MYYRGGIPAYLVEDGLGFESENEDDQDSEPADGVHGDESDRSYDSAAEDDLHDIEPYEEAMRWAQEKEAKAIAQEQVELSLEHFYSGEGIFNTLFFGEPGDSYLEKNGEPQACSKLDGHLQLRPKGEPLCSIVAPFEPPTDVSLDPIELPLLKPLLNDDFRKLILHIKVTFLGGGISRASAPTASVTGYGGDQVNIDFVGVWYDLEKFKRQDAEERRRQEELEAKYEIHPKKTDGLKPWNDI